jgi:hypothetical protein
MTENADIQRLCQLARISHKHNFRSTEEWALEALYSFENQRSSISNSHLVDLSKLALLTSHDRLHRALNKRWMRLIGGNATRDLALVITTFEPHREELLVRRVLGLAYHAMALKGSGVWAVEQLLTRAHRIRLFTGHYALTQRCAEMCFQPIRLPHDEHVCNGEKRAACEMFWGEYWRFIIELLVENQGGLMELKGADLMGLLMLAQSAAEEMMESGSKPTDTLALAEICEVSRGGVQEATAKNISDTMDILVDYFIDVE